VTLELKIGYLRNDAAFIAVPLRFLEPIIPLMIAWVYLHWHFCTGIQKTHLFCNRMRIGRSRSSRVDDFGSNRKCAWDMGLPIVTIVLWSCTVSDVYCWKLRIFPILLSRGAPVSMFRLEVCSEVFPQGNESWGYSPMKTAWSKFGSLIQYQRVTDRQTDGRIIIASTAPCWRAVKITTCATTLVQSNLLFTFI